MSRMDWIKKEKLRLLLLISITALLPFMVEWHNPAGIEPLTAFGSIAFLGWFGVILTLCSPDSYRS